MPVRTAVASEGRKASPHQQTHVLEDRMAPHGGPMKPPLCPHGVRAWTISAENFREVRRALCAAFSIYPGIVVRPPEGALYRYGVQIRDRKRGLVNFALPD